MSAFIVSPECMNRVVNAILCVMKRFDDIDTLQHRDDWCRERIEAGQQIGIALWRMNCQAVAERYREPPIVEAAGYGWQFEPGAPLIPHNTRGLHNVAQACMALKSIDCLVYQCSEGDIPQSPLYGELRAAGANIAHRIVETMPAYSQAPWD